jgi:hypothetical protein
VVPPSPAALAPPPYEGTLSRCSSGADERSRWGIVEGAVADARSLFEQLRQGVASCEPRSRRSVYRSFRLSAPSRIAKAKGTL